MRISRTTNNGVFVNISALKKNVDIIKSIVSHKIISVLKSNSYGLGIENVLPYIINKIYKVAINDCEEFIEHKLYNYPVNFILLFPEIDVDIISLILNYNNVEISLNSFEMLKIFSIFKDKKVNVHLEVDTGMDRTGFRYDEIINLPDNVNIVGLYTHLKNDDIEDNIEQIYRFYEFIERNNIDLKRKDLHLLNSVGVLNYYKLRNMKNEKIQFVLNYMNSVRIGILQYGIVPDYKYLKLKEDLKLESCIKIKVDFLGTKLVKKGESIGYTNRYFYQAQKDTKIGLARVGYSKIPFANKLLFDIVTNKRRFITNSIGSISMDVIGFDLNLLDENEEIKEIYLFSENIQIEEIAEQNGYPVYNFLTSVNSLKKYVYGGDDISKNIE